MKRITLLSALSVVAIATSLLQACVTVDAGRSGENVVLFGNDSQTTIKPNNDFVTKQLTLGDFDEIETAGISVVYSVGAPATATLKASSNIIEYIVAKNDNGTLKLYFDDDVKFNKTPNATLTISSRGIKEITATIGANVNVTTPLTVDDEVELRATTGAVIDMKNLNCEKAEIGITTGAKVNIENLICEGKLDFGATTGSSITVDKATSTCLESGATTGASITVAAGFVGKVDLDATTSGSVKVAAAITGGEASATTAATIRTHVDKLNEITSTTGGKVKNI